MEKITLNNKYIKGLSPNSFMGENKQVLLKHTEEFKFEKVKNSEGKEEIIISGNAMPLGEMSRNKVKYRDESVKNAYKTLEGKAFLNGHDATKSLGHVQESGLSKTHVTYKANIDPEEKEYIRKSERGDIRHVSVGCMVDSVEFMEDGTIECDVVEFVELSAVTVPGFQNTSAEREGLSNLMILTEEFGTKDQLEKLKEKYKDDDDEEEADDSDDDKDKDESDDEDDKDKDKDEKEGDDDSDDDDDEKDEEDDDKDKDDEEEDSDDDKDDEEEKLKNKKKEDADDSEDESIEESVAKIKSRVEELFSVMDEMNNKMAIIEANIDALNDSDEDVDDDKKTDEGLEPNSEEKFTDKKGNIGRTKEELDAKEKALTGENSKKINEDKEIIDMKKVRLKNVSY